MADRRSGPEHPRARPGAEGDAAAVTPADAANAETPAARANAETPAAPAVAERRPAARPLSAYRVRGIGSLIRDLSPLTDHPDRLERQILDGREPLDPELFAGVEVVPAPARHARSGDVVLFEFVGAGAYADIETVGGGRVPLEPGASYVGVLCARVSTKLLSGEVPAGLRLRGGDALELIAQAGGIGRATGYSPVMARQEGSGEAPPVRVIGALRDARGGELLNTIDRAARRPAPPAPDPLPPCVLVAGTATTVGKTTACHALIRELGRGRSCAAIKAAGTGWYEEVRLLAASGADPALDFVAAGLPTTHGVAEDVYLRAIERLMAWAASPAAMPAWCSPPERRGRPPSPPDVLVVELGGDVIAGNVPAFLGSARLMAPVRAIVVCAESALALIGALQHLRLARTAERRPALFTALPFDANPEGFYLRLEPLLRAGALHAIVDFAKPDVSPDDAGRSYARHHRAILSATGLAAALRPLLDSAAPGASAGAPGAPPDAASPRPA